MCLTVSLYTGQIEGLDQLPLLKATHTFIEAAARHTRLVSVCVCVCTCVCTTIDPRPSSKLVWPRPPQIHLTKEAGIRDYF